MVAQCSAVLAQCQVMLFEYNIKVPCAFTVSTNLAQCQDMRRYSSTISRDTMLLCYSSSMPRYFSHFQGLTTTFQEQNILVTVFAQLCFSACSLKVSRQNVRRHNVRRHNLLGQNVRRDKTSRGQNIRSVKTSGRPNIREDKTSGDITSLGQNV